MLCWWRAYLPCILRPLTQCVTVYAVAELRASTPESVFPSVSKSVDAREEESIPSAGNNNAQP